MSPDYSVLRIEEIDHLPYNELRKFAKLYKIKSNQKAVKLRTELKKLLEQSNFGDETLAFPIVHFEENDAKPVASDVDPHDPGASIHVLSSSRVSKNSVHSNEVEVLNTKVSAEQETVTGAACSLNETYELEEPLFAAPTQDVDAVPHTEALAPCTPATTPSRLHEVSSANENVERPPQTITLKKTSIISRVRPVPDFKRIHAAVTAKMESLPQYLERRRGGLDSDRTRPPFASPPFRGGMGAMGTGDSKKTANNQMSLPFSDLTNRKNEGSKTSLSRCTSMTETRKLSGPPPLGQIKPTVKRSTSHIPADSAFARRKAYDTHRRLSITPSKNAAPSNATCHSQSMLRTSKQSFNDPRAISFGAHVAVQKEKAAAAVQLNRNITKRALIDANRGLRC